jgi:hypothetical protein
MKDQNQAREFIDDYLGRERLPTPSEEQAMQEALKCLLADMRARTESGQPATEKVGSFTIYLPPKEEK